MDQATVRRRLSALRESQKLSQVALSQILGFNDRQTLSDIESGKRNVSPTEVVAAANFFGVAVDYFTDPLELAGEAHFSWRKSNHAAGDLAAFENRAGRWIATYRHLSKLKGESVNSSLTQIGLNLKSTLPEASAEGDAVARSLELGDVPAATLSQVLEDTLDTLVLYVDTVAGVSGAASQLGPLNTILINRREAEGRRNFDLGHELFHLITWREMPPQHVEDANTISGRYKHVESLADNFASGLLMPTNAVADFIRAAPIPKSEDEIAPWICDAAMHFRVSGQAVKWRLVCLGLLKTAVAKRIDDLAIRVELPSQRSLPPRFSRRFLETLGWGIDEGQISVRRAAEVVGTTLDDLADLFSEHGLKAPFEL